MITKTYEREYQDLALACQDFYGEFDIILADNKDNQTMSFYSLDTHNRIRVNKADAKDKNKFTNHADAFDWFRRHLKEIENEDFDA